MKIIGIKSICCGKSVKTLPPSKQEGDILYSCLECKKPCDHYYVAELTMPEIQKTVIEHGLETTKQDIP